MLYIFDFISGSIIYWFLLSIYSYAAYDTFLYLLISILSITLFFSKLVKTNNVEVGIVKCSEESKIKVSNSIFITIVISIIPFIISIIGNQSLMVFNIIVFIMTMLLYLIYNKNFTLYNANIIYYFLGYKFYSATIGKKDITLITRNNSTFYPLDENIKIFHLGGRYYIDRSKNGKNS